MLRDDLTNDVLRGEPTAHAILSGPQDAIPYPGLDLIRWDSLRTLWNAGLISRDLVFVLRVLRQVDWISHDLFPFL